MLLSVVSVVTTVFGISICHQRYSVIGRHCFICTGNDGQTGALSKEEQRQMRQFVYHNKILNEPAVQQHIVSELSLCAKAPS